MSNGKWLSLEMKKMSEWMLLGLLLRWALFINDLEMGVNNLRPVVLGFFTGNSGKFYNLQVAKEPRWYYKKLSMILEVVKWKFIREK